MNVIHHGHPGFAGWEAPDWFVALDAESVDRATGEAFRQWLESNPDNLAAYARCEAIVTATGELERDADLAWAFEECAELAAGAVARARLNRFRHWISERRMGLGLAAQALIVFAIAAVMLAPYTAPEVPPLATGQLADTPAEPEPAIGPVAVDLPAERSTGPSASNAQIENDNVDTGTAGSPRCQSMEALEARIRDDRARLDELLLLYTSKHPDVIASRERLRILTAERERVLSELGVNGVADATDCAIDDQPAGERD